MSAIVYPEADDLPNLAVYPPSAQSSGSGAPETSVDGLMHPWLGGANSGTNTLGTTLGMYLFWNPQRITFNRFAVRATSWTTPGTFALGLYQATDRNIRSIANRIASATGQNPGASPATVICIPSEGSVTLEPGWVWVVYGRDSATGAVQLATVQGLTGNLMNNNVIAGTTPIGINTGLAASSGLPTTLDPSAYTVVIAGNVQPHLRLYTV